MTVSLSSREIEVLALAWQCMETEPKINFDELAQLANYGSRNSASVTFGNIKRKLKDITDSSSASIRPAPKTPKTPKAPKTPKSGTKRGAAATDVGDNSTPSKKSRASAKKSKGSSPLQEFDDIHNGDHEDDIEGIKVEVKKEPLQEEEEEVEVEFLVGMGDFAYRNGGYDYEI